MILQLVLLERVLKVPYIAFAITSEGFCQWGFHVEPL